MKTIMYHYIQEYNKDFPGLSFLHISDFQKQLDYFSEKYEFLTRDEWETITAGGRCPDLHNKILLTFDDGLQGHFDYVYPELLRRKLWGIFFVCTQPLVKKSYLGVHKIHLLTAVQKSPKIYEYLLKRYDRDILYKNYNNTDYRLSSYQTQINEESITNLKQILNYYVDESLREVIIDDLFSEFVDIKWSTDFYLSSKRIVEMSKNGMVIGNHTHSHPLLSKKSSADQEVQIGRAQDILSEMGIPNDVFCYPYGGKRSYNSHSLDLLKHLGVKFAFSVEQNDVSREHLTDRAQQLTLPRYDCNLFRFGQRWSQN